jgi:Tol biopolymer transport system component
MVLAALLGTSAWGQRAEVLYQAAQKKEDVDGDLKAAIEGYRRVVTAAGSNRALAAQALVRIGECHEKLGSTEARKAYLQVVGQYADQSEAVARARVRLAALGGSRGTGVSLRQFYDPKAKPEVRLWNVSADGRYAGATDYETANAAVVELATGKSWNVTDYGKWDDEKGDVDIGAISRDGKQMAFWHYHSSAGRGEVRVVGVDGKNARTVYRPKESDTLWAEWGVPTDWSPDGKWIVARIERAKSSGAGTEGTTDFVLLPAAGGERRVVKTVEFTRGYNPRIVFSPDGRYLAFDYPQRKGLAQGDILILPVEGGTERAVATHPAGETLVGWAPDGSIVFLSGRTGTPGLYRVRVTDGQQAGEPELLRPAIGNLTLLGIPRSGNLYYSQQVSESNAYIASLDFATGKMVSPPERVTQRIQDATAGASWSADGRKLAYLHLGRVAIREEGHSEERVLLPAAQLGGIGGSKARWHPDGRSLLARGTKDDKSGLYRIDAATGEASLVWQGTDIADWSADGRWIFRLGGHERRSILRIDTATGEEKVIHTGVPGDTASLRYRVSPDGRWLAFRRGRPGPDPHDDLMVVPTEGGPARQLAELFPLAYVPLGIVWSADGRWVAGAQEQKGESALWVVPAEGGQPRQTDLIVKGSLSGLHVHPDGKRIAYSVSSTRREYWVMENFLPGLR